MTTAARRHPLLVPAGITLLAVCHLLTLDGQALARGSWAEVLGLAVGYVVLGSGVYLGLLAPGAGRVRQTRPSAAPLLVSAPPGDGTALPATLLAEFERWLSEQRDEPELWTAFDQFLREVLSTHLHAGRVRCFRLATPGGALRPLGRAHAAADVTPADSPLLCRVAVTGAPYVRSEAEHAPVLAELARSERESWDWVERINPGGSPLGVVALAMGEGRTAPGRALRELVASLISIQWRCVASLEQSQRAARTDKASGVMTRTDFFEAADEVLRQAALDHEPCVVVAIVIEGLRRLDDSGQWAQRDRLVARLGGVLAQRTRRDDLIGRFSDDRFVILLRRMDVSLGRLIADKIQAAADALVRELFDDAPELGFRAGLAGGELQPTALKDLLVSAFAAAQRARHEHAGVRVGERSTPAGAIP